jgi:hypothetical protein
MNANLVGKSGTRIWRRILPPRRELSKDAAELAPVRPTLPTNSDAV